MGSREHLSATTRVAAANRQCLERVPQEPGGQASPDLDAWFAFAALPEQDFTTKARELSAKFYANNEKGKALNPHVAKLFVATPANLDKWRLRYEALFVNVSKNWESVMNSYEAPKVSSLTNLPAIEKPAALPDTHLRGSPPSHLRQQISGLPR
jgi:hypothetical protein